MIGPDSSPGRSEPATRRQDARRRDPGGAGSLRARWLTRPRVVLTGLVTCCLGLVAVFQTWARGAAADVVLGRVPLAGSGQQVAPGVVGAALVAGAGLIAVSIGGRVLRLLSAAATTLAGVLGVAASVAAARDPAAALRGVAGTSVTSADPVVTEAALTPWPWISAASAALTGLVGLLIVVVGGRWGEPVRRYESHRDATGGAAPRPDDAWDQLTEGEDPTVGPGTPAADGPVPPAPGADR